MMRIQREAVVERRQGSMRWGAAIAGFVTAIGLLLVLEMFGMGLGLVAVDFDKSGSLRHIGASSTIWALVAPLIALFCGGLVAGLLSQNVDGRFRVAHGVVVWALTTVLGLFAMASAIKNVAAGVAHVGEQAISVIEPDAHDVGDRRIDATLDVDRIKDVGTNAADATGKGLLAISGSMLLGLGASILGALVVGRRRKVAVDDRRPLDRGPLDRDPLDRRPDEVVTETTVLR